MLEVSRMPSYSALDSVRCESYRTTPRTAYSDENDDTHKLKSETAEGVSRENTVSRSRVRSAPPRHFSAQEHESLIERLVEDSEQHSLNDFLVFESAVYDDWCEAASGWRSVVPYPKYVTGKHPQQSKYESGAKKGSGRRVSVRCVDDDYGSESSCPSWKANVEPLTYRYIPNNGFYRNSKSNPSTGREWLAVRKNKSERTLNVTPEVRQAQKTLKRDLDNHFKGHGDPASQPVPDKETVADKQRETSQATNGVQPVANLPLAFPFSGKRLLPREQQLMKSASDLFMENFNSRLSALEKDIQTTYSPVNSRKQNLHDPSSGVHHSTLTVSRKIKETKGSETPKSVGQATQDGSPSIGEDLFTVIPIVCKPDVPLRPLEKLTPKQRVMSEPKRSTSVDTAPSPVTAIEQETDIILASATSQPQEAHRDHRAKQGINTARSAIAMTNLDIEKMRTRPFIERSVPLKPEFHTRAKSFYVHPGGSPVTTARKGAMRYTTTSHAMDPSSAIGVDNNRLLEDYRPAIVSRTRETREKEVDSLGDSLPEIMGKRLTVTTTTHRLL